MTAVSVRVGAGPHGRIARCVSSSQSLLKYRLPPGDCCFLCLLCVCVREREGGREYILVTGGGRVSLSVRSSKPNRIRARAFYPRLSRQRPVDPKRAGRAPSMLPSRNGCFCPRLCGPWVRVNVCACVSLPPMLRFLGPSCSGCLPSLSTGRARNLRHRNL